MKLTDCQKRGKLTITLFFRRRPARPTLKPSLKVVENAQQFVDIYRHLPTRPEPLYPQPTPDKTAAKCRKDVCQLPDCYCGGKDIPGKAKIPLIKLSNFENEKKPTKS